MHTLNVISVIRSSFLGGMLGARPRLLMSLQSLVSQLILETPKMAKPTTQYWLI